MPLPEVNLTIKVVNNKPIRIGDVLQGKQSHPVLVVYDEELNTYYTIIIKLKEKTSIWGLVTNANIEYGFTRFTLDEFIESHPDFEVIYNVISMNLKSATRNAGEPVKDQWEVVKRPDGNYNG